MNEKLIAIMKEMIRYFNDYSYKMGELWELFNKEVKKDDKL